MKELLQQQRATAHKLGITETKETPGNISGFSSFYDFGVWTPTLVGATIAGTFVYAPARAGTWYRIGGVVFVFGRLAFTTITTAPTGALSIRGLPFTASAAPVSGVAGGVHFDYWSVLGLGGGANVHVSALIAISATKADLVVSQNAGGAAASLTGATAAITTATDLPFEGQYQV